ncbi:MAG TPA: hypothetical protein PKW90_26360, partial [Myxococcota bacterium]|nr:hypothetical protein [Myxococcota bacterium]
MLIPGDVVDRYIVERELGRGATSAVYQVRHAELGGFFALKLLLYSGPYLRERLVREGKIQAQIRHPHVVGVLDVLQVQGHSALLQEYVDGP